MATTAIFASLAVVNAISVTINVVFLVSSRHYLQATQRLGPWIVACAFFQFLRCFVGTVIGQTDVALVLGDLFTNASVLAGYAYFVLYILVLLRQSHKALKQELDQRKVHAYYAMLSVLGVFFLFYQIWKNVRHDSYSSPIRTLYYTFVLLVILVSFNYLGIRLIMVATQSAQSLQNAGVQNMHQNYLNPLKKTLALFSIICLIGTGILTAQTLDWLSPPQPFPSPLAAFDFFNLSFLAVIIFVTSLHAWIHLDKCQRRGGKDSRQFTKTKQGSGKGGLPSRTVSKSGRGGADATTSDDEPLPEVLLSDAGIGEPGSPTSAVVPSPQQLPSCEGGNVLLEMQPHHTEITIKQEETGQA